MFSKILKILSLIFFFLGVIQIIYFPLFLSGGAYGKSLTISRTLMRYWLNIIPLFFIGFMLRILARIIGGEKFNEIIKLKILPDNYLISLYRLSILLGISGMLWLWFLGIWVSSQAELVLLISIIFVILGVFLRYLSQKRNFQNDKIKSEHE